MKSVYVSELSIGDSVNDFFALRKVELREFPNGKMVSLEIGDRTGRMKGVIWSFTPQLLRELIPGDVYRLKGSVTTYKGENQVTVDSIERQKEYDPEDFLARGPFSIDELQARLTAAIHGVTDDSYRALLVAIFSDAGFLPGFLKGVGGKLWHHNYIGGLAEHTLGVFDLCTDFAARYAELDKDLLLTGALLHDIGKIDSYSLESFIEYSDSGRLLGHIVIGDEIVKEVISRIAGFPADKSLRLRHLILSHQGSPEQSSPIPPMMPEGMALYIADLLDSKLAALRRIRQKEHRPGIRWSNYVNLLDRYIYFGEDVNPDEQEDV
jgi:3'-5' exoribonuclease